MDVTDMAKSLISDLLQSVPSTTTADSNIAEGVHGGMRLSTLEKKEMSNKGTRKRKFLPEELKVALTEFQLQVQALRKRRKLINNGIQAWHGRKKKQCDNQAAKVRIQALKDDDQGAYMRLVKESKDVRLIRIVAETNQLLLKLRSMVQQQRDARNGSQNDTTVKEDMDIGDSNCHDDSVDLLEGQRQYNSTIHSIQEQVKEQPSMLEGGELRPYQLEGLQWMLSLFNNSLNGNLADDMGLGKTIKIISLIAYLKENKGVSGPHLIVAPKVVLPNWMDEFSKWLPNDKIKAVLYDGNRKDRKTIREQLSREGSDVLISHYDLIKIDKLILRKIHWHYLIVDEGHKIKNHKSAFSQIIRGYNAQRKLLLTGTPLQNNVEELWSLLNFLVPEIFDSVDKFQKWFNAPFRPRSSLSKEIELLIIRRLHQVIRPFILRRKDEVEKCLPLKSQFILKCDLSAWQKVYYQQILEEERVGLPPGSREFEEVRNLSMQLRKCCNHPGLFLKNYTTWPKDEIMRASGKFELLDRLLPKLRATGHRVLLFSQMTRLINILEIYLQSHDYKYLRLDGSEKNKKRKESLRKFNDPDSPYFLFLLSTRTGCVGLNLQTADTVIIFDSNWNPQIDLQAEDGAHRIGQDKEVRVFVLHTVGSIEEVILERAKQKKGIDAKVIQAGLFNTKSTEADRREMLEKVMRRGTSSLGTDLPSEREINGLLARSEEELRIFEEMDEERRQKENGRPRLMEEHEVPTWAFSELDDGKVDEHEEGQALEEDNANNVLGKRRRKKVTYAGSGWTMAMEEYAWEPSKISSKKRRRECPSQGHESVSKNGTQTEKKVVVKLKIKLSAPSDRTSEDFSRLAPKRCRSTGRIDVKVKQECCGMEKSDHKSVGGSLLGWNNVPKRRRSGYVVQTPNS